MKIGLLNAYSTLNIGDSAIYSAFAAMAPQAKVYTSLQDTAPRFTPGVEFVDRLDSCNVYISVGGDIFNNARESFVTRAFLRNLGALASVPAARTFVFGQSIPRSCHGLSFAALSTIFRRLSAVCVRDAESHHRLQKAGVKAILSFDAAFRLQLSEPARTAARQIFAALEVPPEQAALISLRAFDSMYKHDGKRFTEQLVALIDKLEGRGHRPVLLLQSQAYGADNDRAVARTLATHRPGVKIFDAFDSPTSLASWEVVMGALSLCRLVIAVRYHTAILALASGRVPFNLHYSNKGRDLTDRLNIPGCGLEQFDPEMLLDVIEGTAEKTFDHDALRTQVQRDFDRCYRGASQS